MNTYMHQIKIHVPVGLLIAIFSLLTTQNLALAADCGGCSPQTNTENLAKTISFAKEALGHVNQGHKDQAKASIDGAMNSFDRIVSMAWAGKMQRPGEDIRYAGYAVKRGDMAKASALLAEAITGLGKIGPFH